MAVNVKRGVVRLLVALTATCCGNSASPQVVARTAPTHTLRQSGQGGESCGTLTRYVADNKDHGPYGAWLAGYLSRAAIAQDRDILSVSDFGGQLAWVDNWCANHPLDSVSQAARSLDIELIKRATSQ